MTTQVETWMSPKGTGLPPRYTGDSGRIDRTWYQVDLKFYLSLTRREEGLILAFRNMKPETQQVLEATMMQLAREGQDAVGS